MKEFATSISNNYKFFVHSILPYYGNNFKYKLARDLDLINKELSHNEKEKIYLFRMVDSSYFEGDYTLPQTV